MDQSPRPNPNVAFAGSVIIRDSYVAECTGVYALPNDAPHKPAVIVNFMEGSITTRDLPPLSEGWRAVAVLLSPEDARALGEALLHHADQIRQV